jgi:hypothetical protein
MDSVIRCLAPRGSVRCFTRSPLPASRVRVPSQA